MVQDVAAIEEILSLRAGYWGPDEVIVMANARPSAVVIMGELTRAMDDLDHRLREALPFYSRCIHRRDCNAQRGGRRASGR